MLFWAKKKNRQEKYKSLPPDHNVVVHREQVATDESIAGVRKALRGTKRIFCIRASKDVMCWSASSSTMSASEVDDTGSIASETKSLSYTHKETIRHEIRRAEDYLIVKGSQVHREEKLKCLPEHASYDEASFSSISTHLSSSRSMQECGICSEPLLGPRFVGACLPCGHCFHEDCFYGSWASSLLQECEDVDDDYDSDSKSQFSGESMNARCLQCSMVVRDFGRLSINLHDAMGPSDGYDHHANNEFAFRKLFARAKMVTLVRRCISVPSSPKIVCEVLRMTMDRIRRSSDVDSCEPGKAVKAEFLAVGGHVAMLQAITRYGDDEDVCGWVNAIAADLAVSHADIFFLTTPNLCSFVASSMLKFPVLQPLQSNGCCIFSELCKSSFAALALQDIDKALGLSAVTDALARFPLETGSLRWNAISFLTLAAELEPVQICEHVCSEIEALECIVSTLHESLATLSPEVGRMVCRLLVLATRRPEFRGSIVKTGGADALQAVYMCTSDGPSKDMSKMTLVRLGRPLNPYQRSTCVSV